MREESIEVQLDSLDWVLELEVAEDLWVDHTNGADLLSVEQDSEAAGWEETGVSLVQL